MKSNLLIRVQEGLDQDAAVLDPLTKLLTRVEFLGALEDKITQYKLDQSPFPLLLVSLDTFRKVLLDGLNREVDQMVLNVAEVIKQETRQPSDIVAC